MRIGTSQVPVALLWAQAAKMARLSEKQRAIQEWVGCGCYNVGRLFWHHSRRWWGQVIHTETEWPGRGTDSFPQPATVLVWYGWCQKPTRNTPSSASTNSSPCLISRWLWGQQRLQGWPPNHRWTGGVIGMCSDPERCLQELKSISRVSSDNNHALTWLEENEFYNPTRARIEEPIEGVTWNQSSPSPHRPHTCRHHPGKEPRRKANIGEAMCFINWMNIQNLKELLLPLHQTTNIRVDSFCYQWLPSGHRDQEPQILLRKKHEEITRLLVWMKH